MPYYNQSNFTKGELSPRLYARTDFKGYYQGAKRLRNVIVVPEGGIKVRFGLRRIVTVSGITSYTESKETTFQYSTETDYLIVFKPLAMLIYHDDALVATVVTPYSALEVNQLRYTQELDVMIVTHPDHKPKILRRTSAHAGWTFNDVTFKNLPVYDFNRNYDSITFTPVGTSGTVSITASAPIFTTALIGGVFFGNNGYVRLTTFVGTTEMTGYTISDFPNVNSIPGTQAFLGEPAWSIARGWPTSVTFYQSRVFFFGFLIF
jgi:hypothetical protein